MLHKDWLKQNRAVFTPRDFLFLEKNCIRFDLTRLEEIKKEYLESKPMAYILGKEEFYGLEFKVDARVLIPRPETELLVGKAMQIIKEQGAKHVLDIGCGSGAIAVTIKKYLGSRVDVTTCDISSDALAIGRENALSHQVEVEFVVSDLFSALSGRKFDLIVSNPPYVDEKDKTRELSFEPALALYSQDNGLALIKKIFLNAPDYLTKQGYLLIEAGYDQKNQIENYCREKAIYKKLEWVNDLQGYARVICLTR